MTNLANILEQDLTLAAADRALEAKSLLEKPRGYLGMSSIGDSCERKLWYSFRWCGREEFDAVTLKRFADGHRTEDLVIDRLKMVEGLDIVATLPDGGQIRIVDHDGHFSGHLDGTIVGILQAPKTPHVLEVKCVSEKKMTELKKAVSDLGEKMALKKWNPVYYGQGQAYMHYMNYTRHYMVVATPGGRDWISVRTDYDPAYALQIVNKAKRIIDAQEPLEKISQTPTWYECKWCHFSGICHEQEMPDRSCRNCVHSTPIENAQWHCARFGEILSLEKQLEACPCHVFIPKLIPAEIQSADEEKNTITYKFSDGTIWTDGER